MYASVRNKNKYQHFLVEMKKHTLSGAMTIYIYMNNENTLP